MDFSALDRCDRCNAQAYYRAEKDGNSLLFCAHHYKRHEDALATSGFSVTVSDNLGELTLAPSM